MRDDLGIPALFDTITNSVVAAKSALPSDDVDLSLLRNRVRKERKSNVTRFLCGLCRDPVYVSNSGGTGHFAHYRNSGPLCPWRKHLALDPDKISAIRFGGKQEGELHQRKILTLLMLCERSDRFTAVGTPNHTMFGIPGTGHRFPDLAAIYDGKRIAFELQISKTYLPVISDREAFYRQNGIYLIWLFHNFDALQNRQTERDIVAMRSRHAFELDDEAVLASLQTRELTFKAYYQVPKRDKDVVIWNWTSRLIPISELVFDAYLVETLASRPWQEEAKLLREIHTEIIAKFENFWFDKLNWQSKLSERFLRKFRTEGVVDRENNWESVATRAFSAILGAANSDAELASRVFELHLDDLLERIFFLRDGKNRFNNQSLPGALDSVLEHWPHFTETICAVASAYGHREIIDRESARKKIIRNLRGTDTPPTPQCRDFDRMIALLCPDAASWLRSSFNL